jgi:hypothetical protein
MELIIEELEEEFTGTGEVKGFLFKQLAWNNHGYLYAVNNQGDIYYEIFKRKTTPICIDFKKRLYSETHHKERYPKGEAFGNWAWTTPNLDKAYEYLDGFNDQKP